MISVSTVNTLRFDQDACTGCGICLHVCPHGVFAWRTGLVHVVHPDACMECGA